MSSTISSAVSTIVGSECACCAANTLQLIKFKKINNICIGCLALLAIGGFSLSTYFAYKLWKLKKTLNNLELKIESLSSQLDLSEEFYDDSDEDTEIEDEEKESSEAEITDDLASSPGSASIKNFKININQEKNSINLVQSKPIAIVSRARPKSPESPDDLNYETPNSSPDRQSLRSSYEEKHLRNGFVKIAQKLEQIDDNKCFDAILNESYESLKSLSIEKQALYENVNILFLNIQKKRNTEFFKF